jgi:hypothetical protein
VAYADEVGRQGTENCGNVQTEYDFLFSGGSDEPNSIIAGGDNI